MFWKYSFQRGYGRFFGSADSKGVSELTNKAGLRDQDQKPARKADEWVKKQDRKRSLDLGHLLESQTVIEIKSPTTALIRGW